MEQGKRPKYINILKDQYFEYEQLNKFFELSADWICIAGFDGYFKKINPAVSDLLGYTTAELMSRPINDFIHTDDQTITSSSRSNIHKGKPLVNFENRYQTKSGEVVWLSWTSIPDIEREVVFAIAKNVTGKKRQEEERNIFTANLSKINEDLKQFTRMTSHDMRSPVSNLMSLFSLLDVSKIADPETLELVSLIKKTSEHLHKTVNNFVDVLIENDKLKVPVEDLNLAVCLDGVTESIKSLIAESHTAIAVDFSAFEDILFNRFYLESIFLNLITNSIKYSHPDQYPKISIATRVVNDTCQLIIADNGLGFDLDKVRDRVFGLYQVFHNRSDSKGIGLHLVYTHVNAMGGHISINSKVNEGTTFTISFKRTK
ncbi:PAS domain-containing sensor histidine kinase [Pedobacter sp. L105]|uniref:PAS domain-containing sensor histidine kinase n=1 Tax=Pedobacter sp. L105 TaxID=1641871 RepID=UPI00131C6122|nr:PAS domain-containing sensor histidine kinase [Pedobacter sp. L105]